MKTIYSLFKSNIFFASCRQLFFVMLLICLGCLGLNAQGNETQFAADVTIDYSDCNGVATITFPVRNDDYSNFANFMRYIVISASPPGGGIVQFARIYKNSITASNGNICTAGTEIAITGAGAHRTWDVCTLGANTSLSIINGTGGQRLMQLVLTNLGSDWFGSAIEFDLVGRYDTECCQSGQSNLNLSYGFSFNIDKSWMNNQLSLTVPQASISSVSANPCQLTQVNWSTVDPPANCGTVKYDIWRGGYGFVAQNISGTSFPDPGLPLGYLPAGVTYNYQIRSRWKPQGSPREDFSNWSGAGAAGSTILVPQPDGSITVNVKTTAGVPVPGVLCQAQLYTGDASPACGNINTLGYINIGVTDANGTVTKNNIFYGHPNDTPTEYIITGTLNSNNISTQNVLLDNLTPGPTANLTDHTSYTVNGKLLSANGCGIEDATITADGHNPLNVGNIPSATTGVDGSYTILLPGQDNYGFYSSYVTASETVEDSTNMTISNTTTNNVNIQYSKTNIVQGFVGGDCMTIFGSATITAYSEANGCPVATTTSNAGTGMYQMTLPAHPMVIKVENFMPTSGPLVGQTLTQSQDITLDSTTTMDFIFRSPIALTVLGLPDQLCSDISFPILEQFKPYPLVYLVEEGTGCPVDTGYIIITDEISSPDGMSVLDTIPISNGIALDTLIPGIPKIFGNYSKPITLQAFAGQDPATAIAAMAVSFSAVVTGSAPRGTQFTTVSPQIPRLILRDPPGDDSYSFITEGQTFSTSTSMYTQDSEGGSFWAKAKAGVEIDLISFEAGIEIGATFGGESVHLDSEETLFEFATSSTYNTSQDPSIAGKEGDVYIGAAMNLSYANSDIISLDLAACKIDKRVELVINPDSFSTKFVYAESDIVNLIIPTLQLISIDPIQSAEDRHRAKEGVKIWNQVINLNAETKAAAFETATTENQSFGGSAGFIEHTFTTTTTKTKTIEWKQLINEDIAVEAGFSLGGSGISAGFEINLKQEFGGSTTNGTSTSTTVGFHLNDNTPGDLYTVDWAFDPVFGTPVFRAAQDAGQTSCPWELGAKRDKPYFSIANPIKYAGSGVNSLIFTFELGNNSEVIPADLSDYTLDLLASSNLQGAMIQVVGYVGSNSWAIDEMPHGNANYTVLVSRNTALPFYHYEGLRFRFYPTCDPSQAIYRNISAFFESPCSDVSIGSPTVNNGFLINQTTGNNLAVQIKDYDYTALSNTDIVKLEYAVSGANVWNTTNISDTKTFLNNNNPATTTKTWNVSTVPDGVYDIRMEVVCMDGANATSSYSERVTGIIDRMPPEIVGVPFPSDDDFESDDEIGLILNESIDLTNALLTLTLMPDNIVVPATFNYVDSIQKVTIIPSYDISVETGKIFEVTLSGIEDMNGNLSDAFEWDFTVGEIDMDDDGYTDNYEQCIGSALHFDKSGTITVPHDPVFNVVENGLDFTFEAWVYHSGNNSNTIISKGVGFGFNTEYIFQIQNTGLALYLSGEWQYGDVSVPIGEWSHVAVTVDGATKTTSFYINGIVTATKTFGITTFMTGESTPFYIGRQGATCNCNLFDGRMDDLIVWQHELTQAEIMATMAGKLTGNEADLVAYYDFDDYQSCAPNTGNTTIVDKSTNANNGTLYNFGLTGCNSNWATERSMDSDRDGIPDGCDEIETCFDLNDTGDTDGDLLLACVDLCPTTKDVALDFDGVYDYLYYGPDPTLTFLQGDFAFEAWINPKGNTYEPILLGWDPSLVGVFAFDLRYQKIALFLRDAADTVDQGEYLFSETDVPLNQWSHVAVSFDASTKEATFYLNGKFDGKRKSELTTIVHSSNMYSFYGWRCIPGEACGHFDGQMDDIAVWERTLSEYNIKQSMAAPLTGTENDLTLFLDLNEGLACTDNSSISIVADKSPNAYDFSVIGFSRSDCSSNWVTGRNTDSDGDLIGDACDVSGFGCPPDYAGANQLIGNQTNSIFFDTDGAIESSQKVKKSSDVIYNTNTSVELLADFEVELGTTLEVKLDGCPD